MSEDCDHVLLPGNGAWVNIIPGEKSDREIYCAECGAVFRIRRKNIETERVGNLNELNDE